MNLILHITTAAEWQAAQAAGSYQADSLASEGFIHCSMAQQVVATANAIFPGRAGLLLLAIDAARRTAPLRYEDCYETGQQFPHIYGPLNLDAVVAVHDFPPTPAGSFNLPPALAAQDFPILEYDPAPQALIEPAHLLPQQDVPAGCVLCFFQEVLTSLQAQGTLIQRHSLGSEIGPNPVYEMTLDGRRLGVCHPGLGAPLAAGFLEELIALGYRQFIACGGAGVLRHDITVGHLVIPTSAVRDEGTSYHYLPPAREVAPSPAGVAALELVLQQDHVPYLTGKTWTTDAFYRETPARIQRRRAEGCLTVEMEAAAFFAVAQFRGVTFAQLLYGGDDVSSDTWDPRRWSKRASVREKLFWLAAEACLRLRDDA